MSIFPTNPGRQRSPALPRPSGEPQWFASCAPGLEAAVQRELGALPALQGVALVAEVGGVGFSAPLAVGARVAHMARTPSRLLVRVGSARATSLEHAHQVVRGLDWTRFLAPGDRRAIDEMGIAVSSSGSRLNRRDAIEKKVRLAIGDALRGAPAVRRTGPTPVQHLLVRLEDDQLTLSLCAGGELLHRRGWRTEAGRAPLRENLAAAMLVMAGYSGDEALLDPFCGSGTLPIEAALLAAGRSPFVGRTLACETWPDLPAQGPEPRPRPFGAPIFGSDRDPRAIEIARSNAARAGVRIEWLESDVDALDAPADPGLLVANPPYGHRLGSDVASVYATLGRALHGPFAGWRLLFLAPEESLARRVDPDVVRLTSFQNGGLRVGVWATG